MKEIRGSIMSEVVTYLHNIFAGVGRPGIGKVREIVAEMGYHYPAMFKYNTGVMGYGLGGNKGLSGLANHMLDALRRRDQEQRKLGLAMMIMRMYYKLKKERRKLYMVGYSSYLRLILTKWTLQE